jgi:hypothetical protein
MRRDTVISLFRDTLVPNKAANKNGLSTQICDSMEPSILRSGERAAKRWRAD